MLTRFMDPSKRIQIAILGLKKKEEEIGEM